MNYLGHVHVALAADHRDPHTLLGAALPDLTSMAGVRVDRDQLDPRVATGVRCHLAADDVFHRHRVFRDGCERLRRELAAVGAPRGPARAAAHIGWELLLDGTLVRSEVEAAYWDAAQNIDTVTSAVRPTDQARWSTFLARLGGARSTTPSARPVLRYDDPSWVAERVMAALSRRPRLRLDPSHLLALTTALTSTALEVHTQAGTVLSDVATQLSPEPEAAR